MSGQRLVLGAVAAFAVAWGALVALAAGAEEAPAPAAPAAPAAPPTRLVGAGELARHATPDDCWIAVRGKVYDVTTYVASHPTRPEVVTRHCGKESTVAFETKERGRPHSPRAWAELEAYLVGELREGS